MTTLSALSTPPWLWLSLRPLAPIRAAAFLGFACYPGESSAPISRFGIVPASCSDHRYGGSASGFTCRHPTSLVFERILNLLISFYNTENGLSSIISMITHTYNVFLLGEVPGIK